jgi:ERCC4-type nuclease
MSTTSSAVAAPVAETNAITNPNTITNTITNANTNAITNATATAVPVRGRAPVRLRPKLPGDAARYEVVLLIDSREKQDGGLSSRGAQKNTICKVLTDLGCVAETRTLGLGDMIFIAREKAASCPSEYVLDVIIERKTIADLESSIRDGRFLDQRLRLLHSTIPRRVYLVEGRRRLPVGADKMAKSVCTALARAQIDDGLRVIETGDTRESVGVLAALYAATCDSLAGILREWGPYAPPLGVFNEMCAKDGRLSATLEMQRVLRLVHGVTAPVSDAIVRHFPTAAALVEAYEAAGAAGGGALARERLLSSRVEGIADRISRDIARIFAAQRSR